MAAKISDASFNYMLNYVKDKIKKCEGATLAIYSEPFVKEGERVPHDQFLGEVNNLHNISGNDYKFESASISAEILPNSSDKNTPHEMSFYRMIAIDGEIICHGRIEELLWPYCYAMKRTYAGNIFIINDFSFQLSS